MVGAVLLWLGLRGRTAIVPVVAGALLLVPAPLGAYASHVEPHRIVTEVVALDLADERAGTDSVRLGVLADLQTNHIGAYENEAVDALLATDPDVILIPGDLFQGNHEEFERELEPLRTLLSRLDAPGGVYFVQGDSDHWWRMQQILPGTGITPLFNEIVDVQVGDRILRIGGTTITYDSDRAQTMVRSLEGAPEDGTTRILVSHRPDVVDTLPQDSRVDLVVAGHTHGGQIALPFFGPPVTLSEVPRDVARGGLHEVNGNAIVVSTGVGLVRGQAPQVRFLSRPSVVAVDLR
jgi:predicted MPP superfamily phosphohydrolase